MAIFNKHPPRLRVATWHHLILALCAIIAIGCAAHLTRRGHLVPDDVREWEAVPCTNQGVRGVYALMLQGVASPGQVMYYFRCKNPERHERLKMRPRPRSLKRPVHVT